MTVQLRTFITDYDSDFEAYVVVDSLVDGHAMGGTRMTPTVDVEEVANLAHSMTLKLALAELPLGGAKAGIRSKLPAGPERDRRLADFGRAVAPLLHGGVYLGVDQGISYPDREIFLEAAQFDPSQQLGGGRLPCSWADFWARCHDITGFGICESLDAASHTLQLAGCQTVAIQGFGAVGRSVAAGLARRGFRVVAVADYKGTIQHPDGLPVQALLEATDNAGTIDRASLPMGLQHSSLPDAWLQIDADVLVLAAGGNAINTDNAHLVHNKVIVEGGNFACSQEAHSLLAERNIPVLPAIVVNAGAAMVTGLIFLDKFPGGLDIDELVAWFHTEIASRIRRNVEALLARSASDPRPLTEIAETLATEKLQKASLVLV